MLVSFAVSNFLSFKDRAELSMLAVESDGNLPENIHNTPLGKESQKTLPLLKSAVIYGPNASGKSNLLASFGLFSDFIISNGDAHEASGTGFTAFALDPEKRNAPSEFEVRLLLDGTLYRYGFTADAQQVHDEWLFASGKKKELFVFERIWNRETGTYSYEFGPTGNRFEKLVKEDLIRKNALLLTIGSQRNEKMAKAILAYFIKSTHIVYAHNRIEQRQLPIIENILKFADIGIESIRITPYNKEELINNINKDANRTEEEKKQLIDSMYKNFKETKEISFLYKNSQNEIVSLDEDLQSRGTIALLNIIEHLLCLYESGGIFILDEIESSLHPMLCEGFLRLFHRLPSDNIQLICTTHNPALLNADLFRRDQVWLTEKERSGSTSLTSISEFKGTRKEARLGKQYLDGRFGALPILDERFLDAFLEQLAALPKKEA